MSYALISNDSASIIASLEKPAFCKLCRIVKTLFDGGCAIAPLSSHLLASDKGCTMRNILVCSNPTVKKHRIESPIQPVTTPKPVTPLTKKEREVMHQFNLLLQANAGKATPVKVAGSIVQVLQ